MLELQNSCERELDDWAALFAQADSRFSFLGGQQPTGSNLWIMTARWEMTVKAFEGVLTEVKSEIARESAN